MKKSTPKKSKSGEKAGKSRKTNAGSTPASSTLTIRQSAMGKITVLNGSLPKPTMVVFKFVSGMPGIPARVAHPAYRMGRKFEFITPVVFTLTDEGGGRLTRTKIKGSLGDWLIRYNNLLMYLSHQEFDELFEEIPE